MFGLFCDTIWWKTYISVSGITMTNKISLEVEFVHKRLTKNIKIAIFKRITSFQRICEGGCRNKKNIFFVVSNANSYFKTIKPEDKKIN